MNKLVSKNPVLRFKLGKKIPKAQLGTVLNYAGRYLNPVGAVAAAYDIYNAIIPNTVTNAVTKPLSNFYYGYDRDAYLKRLNKPKVKPNPGTGTRNTTNLSTQHTPLPNEVFNVNNPETWGRSIGTVTVTPRTSKPSVAPTYYATRAYRNKILPEGLNSRAAVMEYLKKLNKFGANIKVDGIWGDKTQAAYEALLKITPDNEGVMNLGTMNNIEASVNSLLNPNPILSPDSWIAKANSLNNLHYNIDPIFAKQGAKLVSRNPIERFLQGRNLPTAPKAEDRYKNGRRTWNMPQYKEVSSASNIFGDPFASRIAMEVSNNGNDTTFYETPGRWLPVNFRTRTASKKNKNFRTLSLRPELFTLESKTIIIDPEYETLKRRFNTAWNLAK